MKKATVLLMLAGLLMDNVRAEEKTKSLYIEGEFGIMVARDCLPAQFAAYRIEDYLKGRINTMIISLTYDETVKSMRIEDDFVVLVCEVYDNIIKKTEIKVVKIPKSKVMIVETSVKEGGK